MRVLITGGAGFIGSNLARRCVEEGYDTHIVDDMSNGHEVFIPEGVDRVMIECFSSKRILDGLIKQKTYDVVFHIAAVPRVSYSVEYPLETNEVNVSRTLELLNACKGNVRRVVFASSSSVYGGADVSLGPTHENHPRDPKSPYALQKAVIEDYLRLYSELYGLDSACLRFFNVFGPNQLGDSPYATAVSAWLTAIKNGRPMRSDGDGEQSRDMCYVDNVVDACIRAAQRKDDIRARCYNVACGDRTTNNQILEALLKRYPGSQVTHAPVRPGDVKHTHADVRRAEEELGYKPLVRFWEGLDRTIDWYEENWSLIQNLKLHT